MNAEIREASAAYDARAREANQAEWDSSAAQNAFRVNPSEQTYSRMVDLGAKWLKAIDARTAALSTLTTLTARECSK